MAKENERFLGMLLDDDDNPIDGSEFIGWKSRSIAVVCLIVSRTSDNSFQFLLERRGPGCPDFVGCYCAVCGYLGWDETLRDAAVRETFEETGLKIQKEDLKFIGINDNPSEDKRQNVSVQFLVEVEEKVLLKLIDEIDLRSDIRGGEKNEVDEITLVPYFFIKDNSSYFAFGHDKLIKYVVENYDKL